TWSACVCVSSTPTSPTSCRSAASRYCSIASAGATTTAVCACSSPTREEAHPRSSSTNCLNSTTATLATVAAISGEVCPGARMTGMKSWERKSALNEALWREVNERIDEVDEAMRVLPDDAQLTFHCECGEQ